MTTDASGLYRLMAWLSPSYPVGAFTLSHGLEWAVEDGTVTDLATLADWVGGVLDQGGGRQDAILFACAWRARRTEISVTSADTAPASAHGAEGDAEAASSSAHSREGGNPGPHNGPSRNPPWIPAFAGMSGVKGKGGGQTADDGDSSPDPPALAEIVELAAALNPSKERRTETLSQGDAFRKITETAWPASLPWPEGPLAYPVAVAIAAADHGVALDAALVAYLHGFSANIVSAGVRLVPLGQSDGQRAIARLEPAIARIAAEAETSTLDDLGGCALLADIASMRHETQYTRLFRT